MDIIHGVLYVPYFLNRSEPLSQIFFLRDKLNLIKYADIDLLCGKKVEEY